MGTGWIWNAIVAVFLLMVTLVSARLCVLGTEPDESVGGKVRFVLPPGDPCSCTEIMLGGHNAYATPRKDKPLYIDNLPTDAEGLRRSQGCHDESTQRESTQTSILQVETSNSPTTREARVPAVYTDCQEAFDNDQITSGVFTIQPYGGNEHFDAYCDMTTDKGYIVIQKRLDGSVDFNRNWIDYRDGFGNLEGEFWLGNEKLYKITSKGPKCELLVILTAFDGSVAQARYGQFLVKEGKDDFTVDGGEFTEASSSAGDAFEGKKFSTFDRDNDGGDDANCAESLGGGWWYTDCVNTRPPSNLNGVYHHDNASVEQFKGIYWSTWSKGNSHESLKATEMKIRFLYDKK